MSAPLFGFELEKLTIPLENIFPVRQIKEVPKKVNRYKTVLASIKEVGVIEPLMIIPKKGRNSFYLIMDGHLRYYAMKELGIKEAECLIAREDESFTYNARVNRLAPIQEHRMIAKAVKNGVKEERIAAALNLNPREIRLRLNLLTGIHEEAVEILKDKEITAPALRALRRVTPVRQIEIAEMMVSVNNFTQGYAEALLISTSKDQLVNPEKPKTKAKIAPEEIARMEQEMEAVEKEFKAAEDSYSDNMLHLTVIRGYVKKLLENARVVRLLSSRHADTFSEFERIAMMETL